MQSLDQRSLPCSSNSQGRQDPPGKVCNLHEGSTFSLSWAVNPWCSMHLPHLNFWNTPRWVDCQIIRNHLPMWFVWLLSSALLLISILLCAFTYPNLPESYWGRRHQVGSRILDSAHDHDAKAMMTALLERTVSTLDMAIFAPVARSVYTMIYCMKSHLDLSSKGSSGEYIQE